MPPTSNINHLKKMAVTMIRRVSRKEIVLDDVYAEMEKMADHAEKLENLSSSQRVGRALANAAMVVFNDIESATSIPKEEKREALHAIMKQLKTHIDSEFPDDAEHVSITSQESIRIESDEEESDEEESDEEEEEDEVSVYELGTQPPEKTPPPTQVPKNNKRARAESPCRETETEGNMVRQNAMVYEEL